jgi:Kef-type K+ transport system membrane component KefB
MIPRPLRPLLIAGLTLGLLFAHLFSPAFAQGNPATGAAGAPAGAAEPGHPQQTAELLLGLVIILVGAKLGGEAFERLGQPAVLGELGVGILVGNLTLGGIHSLEFLRSNAAILALSELGVILLLFEVGLESNMQDMRRVGMSSFVVAILGVVAPSALGWAVARLMLPEAHPLTHVFIGTALCATSVGITARVLRDLGQLQRAEAQIVLGAAVIDDVMGLVVLAVVGGLVSAAAGGQSLPVEAVLLIVAKAVAFLFGALALGSYLSPKLFRLASFLNIQHMLLVTSLGFCFLLALLAAQIGLAPIVGAFAAGLILDRVHYQDFTDRGEHHIEELIRPIGGFLVPVFFVVTGMNVDLRALANPGALGLALALTVAAIIGKQVCGLGVLQRGLDRLSVGLGMIPRGEVGLIFANIGLGLHVLGRDGRSIPVVDPTTFAAIIIVVMVTTLITPSLLKWSLSRSSGPGGETPEIATEGAPA